MTDLDARVEQLEAHLDIAYERISALEMQVKERRLVGRATSGSAIIDAAARVSHITPQELMGDGRMREYVRVRQALCLVLIERGWAYNAVGELMNRDRSTVWHNVNAARDLLRRDLRHFTLLVDRLRVEVDKCEKGAASNDRN